MFLLSRTPAFTKLASSYMRHFAVTGRKSKNVANKKNKVDAMKTKLYNRLGIKILMAAKAGGIDPSTNPELARALKEASDVKLPKENIERSLKKAADKNDVQDYKSGTYEVFGHAGVGIVIVSLTDNTNRVNMAIKAAARKADVKMASPGSVLFQFLQKGRLDVSKPYEEDSVIEAALTAGVDEVDFLRVTDNDSGSGSDNGSSVPVIPPILVAPTDVATMQDGLNAVGISSVSSLVFIPTEQLVVTGEGYDKNIDLIELFEDLDDVDSVYHNMADS